jgi:hypothetical protein
VIVLSVLFQVRDVSTDVRLGYYAVGPSVRYLLHRMGSITA